MTSLMTNVAAMTALQTLQATNSAMDAAQSRISTGYRVADAKDNAAYWSISTTMRSDNMAMSAAKDSMGVASALVDTTYTGLDSAKDVLNEIKAKMTTATQDGVDKSKVQDEITQLQKQLRSIANSASFSGQNWLSVDAIRPQASPSTRASSQTSPAIRPARSRLGRSTSIRRSSRFTTRPPACWHP